MPLKGSEWNALSGICFVESFRESKLGVNYTSKFFLN